MQAVQIKIDDSHLTCKVANTFLNVRERVEVVEWNKRWFPPFPCYPLRRQCPWKKIPIGVNHKGCPHLSGRRGLSQKNTAADRSGSVNQMWMSTLKKKVFFSFFIIVWKYFLSNINSIFECSLLDKIRLDCKVYPFPTHLLHVLPVYRRSKNYFLICQSIVIWWVTSLNEFHRISPWFVVNQFI